MKNKIILTDADGVLLDWEYAFNVWMEQHGFTLQEPLKYNIGKRYGIDMEQGKKLIKVFHLYLTLKRNLMVKQKTDLVQVGVG